MSIIKKEIKTVKDLKEMLINYDDELLFNVGTERLGFEIDGYGSDCLSFGLLSTDLEDYFNTIKGIKPELSTYAIYVEIKGEKHNREEYHYEANSIEEALGKFFMENENFTYVDIIDHMEI